MTPLTSSPPRRSFDIPRVHTSLLSPSAKEAASDTEDSAGHVALGRNDIASLGRISSTRSSTSHDKDEGKTRRRRRKEEEERFRNKKEEKEEEQRRQAKKDKGDQDNARGLVQKASGERPPLGSDDEEKKKKTFLSHLHLPLERLSSPDQGRGNGEERERKRDAAGGKEKKEETLKKRTTEKDTQKKSFSEERLEEGGPPSLAREEEKRRSEEGRDPSSPSLLFRNLQRGRREVDLTTKRGRRDVAETHLRNAEKSEKRELTEVLKEAERRAAEEEEQEVIEVQEERRQKKGRGPVNETDEERKSEKREVSKKKKSVERPSWIYIRLTKFLIRPSVLFGVQAALDAQLSSVYTHVLKKLSEEIVRRKQLRRERELREAEKEKMKVRRDEANLSGANVYRDGSTSQGPRPFSSLQKDSLSASRSERCERERGEENEREEDERKMKKKKRTSLIVKRKGRSLSGAEASLGRNANTVTPLFLRKQRPQDRRYLSSSSSFDVEEEEEEHSQEERRKKEDEEGGEANRLSLPFPPICQKRPTTYLHYCFGRCKAGRVSPNPRLLISLLLRSDIFSPSLSSSSSSLFRSMPRRSFSSTHHLLSSSQRLLTLFSDEDLELASHYLKSRKRSLSSSSCSSSLHADAWNLRLTASLHYSCFYVMEAPEINEKEKERRGGRRRKANRKSPPRSQPTSLPSRSSDRRRAGRDEEEEGTTTSVTGGSSEEESEEEKKYGGGVSSVRRPSSYQRAPLKSFYSGPLPLKRMTWYDLSPGPFLSPFSPSSSPPPPDRFSHRKEREEDISGSFTFRIHSRRNAEEKRGEEEEGKAKGEEEDYDNSRYQQHPAYGTSSSSFAPSSFHLGGVEEVVVGHPLGEDCGLRGVDTQRQGRRFLKSTPGRMREGHRGPGEEERERRENIYSSSSSLPSSLHVRFQKRSPHAPSFISSSFSSAFHPYSTTSCTGDFSDLSPTRGREGDRRDRRGLGPSSSFAPSPSSYSSFSTSAPSRSFAAAGEEEEEKKMKRETLLLVDFQEVSVVVSDMRKKVEDICKKVRLMSEKMMVSSKGRRKGGRDTSHLEKGLSSSSFSLYNSREKTDMMNLDREMVGKKRSSLKSPVAFEEDRHTSFLQGSRRGDKKKSEDLLLRRLSDDEEEEEDDEEKWRHVDEAIPVEWDFPPFLLHPLYTTDVDSPSSSSALSPLHPLYRTGGQRRGAASSLFRLKKKLFLFVWIYASSFRSFREDEEELKNLTKELFRDTDEIFIELPSFLEENGGRTHAHPHSETGSENKRDVDDLLIGVFKIPLTRSSSSSPVSFHTTMSDHFLCSFFVPSTLPIFVDHSHCQFFYYPFEGEDEEEEEEEEDDLKRGGSLKRNASSFRAAGMAGLKNAREGRLLSSLSSSSRLQTFDGGFDDTFDSLRRRGISNYLPQSFSRGIRRRDEDEGIERLVERRINGVSFNECYLNQHRVWIRGSPLGVPSLKRKKWRIYQSKRFASSSLSFFFPLSDDEEEEQEEKKSSPPSSKRYRTHGGLAGGTVLAGKGRGPLSLGDFVVVDQKEEEEINRRRRKLRERKKDSLEIKEKERRRTKAGETIDEEREEENGVRLDCPQVSTVEWMKREGLWRRDDFLKEEEERSSETSFASCEDEDHEEEETEGKKGRGRRGVRSIRSILSSSSTSQIPSSCSSIPTSSLKGGESSFFLSNDTRRHRQPGTPSFSSPPPLPRCPTAGFSRCLLDKREKRREEQKERRERSSSRRRRRHKGGKRREEGRHLLSSSDPRKKGRRDGFFSSSSFFSSSPPTSPGASEEEERRRKDRSPVFLLSERKKDRPIPSGDRTRRDLIFPFSSSPPSRRGDVHLLLPSDRPSPRIFTPRSQLHRNGDEGGEQKKRALLSLLPSIQTHTPPPSVPPLRSPSERRKLLSSGSPLSSSRLLPQAIFPFPSRKKRFSDSERDLLHSQGSARSLQGATRRDDRESRLSVRSPRGEEEEEKRRGRERGETQLTVPKIVFKKEPEERTVASPVSRRSGPEEVEEERKKREKERTEQELRGENRCIDSHIPRSEEERRSKEEAEKEEEKKKKENITTDLSFSSSSPPLVLLIEKYMKEKSGEEEKKEKRGEEEKKEKRGEEEKEEKSGEEGEKEKIGGGEKERSEERKVTDKDKKNYHKGIEEENTSTCVSSTSSSVKNRTSSSSCSLSQKEESEKTRRVLKKKRYLCGYDEDNEGEIGGEVARAAIALRMKELLRQQGEGEEDEDRDLGLLFGLSEKRKERRDSSADGEEEEVDLSIFDRKSFERDLRNLRESSTASQKAEGASMKVKEEEEERRRRREEEEKDRGEEEDEFLRKQGKDRETFSPSSSSALSSDMSRVLLLDRENRFLAPVYLQQKHSTWESQENLLKLLEEEEYERHLRIENAKKRLQDLSLQETLLSPSCRSKKRQERSLYLRHALEQKRKNNPRQDEGKDYLSSSGEDGDSLSSSFSKEEEEDPCSSSVVKSEEKRRKEVTEEMIREERRRDEERIRKDLSQQEQRIKRPSSSDIKSRKDPLHSSRRVSPQELRPSSSPPLSKRPSLDSSTHALHGGKEKKSNLSSRDHSSSSLHPSCGRLSKLPSRDASVEEEEEKKKKKDLPQSQDFSSSSSPLPPAIHLAEQHSSEDALLEMKNKKTDLLSSSSSSLFPSTRVSLSLSKGASLGDKKEKNKKKDHALQSKRVPSASSSSVPLSTDLSEYLLPSKDDLLYHERKKDPSSSACPIGLSTPPSRHSSNDALHGDEKKKDFLHFVSPTSSSFSSSSPPALPSSRLLSPSLSKDSLAQDEKEKNKKKDHLFPSKRDPSSPSFSSSSLFRRPRRKESPPSASRGSSVRRDRRDNKEKEKTSRSSSLLREEKEEKRSLLSLSSSPSSLSLRKTLTSPRDTAEKIKGKPVEKESSCLNGEGEVKKEKKENSSPRIHRKETIHRRPSSSLQEEKRSLLSLSSSPSSLSLRKTLASPRDTSEKINRKTLSSPRALQASASLSRLHSPKLSAKQTKLVSPGDLLDVPSPSKEHANRPSIGRKEKEDDGR